MPWNTKSFCCDLGRIKHVQKIKWEHNENNLTQNAFPYCDHIACFSQPCFKARKTVKSNSILDMKYWFQLASNLLKIILIVTEEQQNQNFSSLEGA